MSVWEPVTSYANVNTFFYVEYLDIYINPDNQQKKYVLNLNNINRLLLRSLFFVKGLYEFIYYNYG